jgi:hypothetical protein
MKIKCLQHNRVVEFGWSGLFHETDKSRCYSRLLCTPYDNKEPDNEQEEDLPDRPAGGIPGLRGSGGEG